jgi:pilus assembly protein Flp/PilA
MFGFLKQLSLRLRDEVDGAVFVEYVLLVTLVGLGAIVGLSTVRDALINELNDLALAITALNI